MKKVNTKQMLFEMMEKINPDFDYSNVSGDVRNASQLRTTAQKAALSKVNTQREFNEAFESWFNTLGVSNRYKDSVNITTSVSYIREVMEKKGIKN